MTWFLLVPAFCAYQAIGCFLTLLRDEASQNILDLFGRVMTWPIWSTFIAMRFVFALMRSLVVAKLRA